MNEEAKNKLVSRIKDRVAYHSNEHRHYYELGKGVLEFFALDVVADFAELGGLLSPVKPGSTVYIIRRKKAKPAEVVFVGFGADGTIVFNVFYKGSGDSFATYQFDGNDIGKLVFLTKEEAEKEGGRV